MQPTVAEAIVEFSSIRREVFIEAPPDIVFDVISEPEQVVGWFSDEARFEPTAGSTGELVFHDRGRGGRTYSLTVVDVQRPHRFSFRWCHPVNETATAANSLLVTFDLAPSGDGTLLRMTETGFGERAWDTADRDWYFEDHTRGWDLFLPNLVPYLALQRRQP
jgi:uncharacterized protein YndB with AHSA1/START domain